MLTHFAFAGLPGGYEVLIIGFVALLIFGNRLPTLMRSLGQGVTEFKKGINEIKDDASAVTKKDDDKKA